jgi:hypothetical protein
MLLEAFGECSLSRTAVFEWHSHFKAGWVSVENDERSRRPSTRKTTENVKKILELIHKHRRRTIHELADTVGISYARKNRNCGVTTTGSSIMTTCPPTCPWKPRILWLTTNCLSFPILPTHRT